MRSLVVMGRFVSGNVQCFLKILLILYGCHQCIVSLSDCLGFRASFLSLNLISLMWLAVFCVCILFVLICVHVICLKFVSFVLILRYRFVSPLLIALMVGGGGEI